jgi:hypothetical protein
MSRLLRRWGILDALRPQSVNLHALSLRRYADDIELARAPMASVEEIHGAPIWVAHRADLQSILKKGVEDAGAQIETGSYVDLVTTSTSNETFKICRACSAGYFHNKLNKKNFAFFRKIYDSMTLFKQITKINCRFKFLLKNCIRIFISFKI